MAFEALIYKKWPLNSLYSTFYFLAPRYLLADKYVGNVRLIDFKAIFW
jgi:hypothetical protein